MTDIEKRIREATQFMEWAQDEAEYEVWSYERDQLMNKRKNQQYIQDAYA